jgi:hypothetical protein
MALSNNYTGGQKVGAITNTIFNSSNNQIPPSVNLNPNGSQATSTTQLLQSLGWGAQ